MWTHAFGEVSKLPLPSRVDMTSVLTVLLPGKGDGLSEPVRRENLGQPGPPFFGSLTRITIDTIAKLGFRKQVCGPKARYYSNTLCILLF